MGNMHCPPEDAALLASVAQDICPFPNYSPNPLFINVLSINSSLHLRNHYMAVQSSLTPKQLEDFTQGLRTTFGRDGKVTLGGVGVVALSLAVLFDTLARQVRGEWVSDSGPIPGLFVKNLRGYYPAHVYTVSEYLRLIPHIANNPTRMIEESEKYHKQLVIDHESWDKLVENHTMATKDDTTAVNVFMEQYIAFSLSLHLSRITNFTGNLLDINSNEFPTADIIWNLNCDLKAADKEFLAKVKKSDKRTQEAFESCTPKSGHPSQTWLQHVAKLVMADVLFLPAQSGYANPDSIVAHREHFDLKAHALKKWVE
ncbi:uncharacterized protein LOC116700135 [Etheostoma spectabile]|uniref:uncharacterized protein LOC116698654 n=1 Tax=Etheostoma spectabile TaxID=54343 RepID=UPI0013AE9DE8|nr:uncharacterized protein LOC116698654 [Etheostoma spectabile]XP_032388941.1 uncharacterized protein LOC116700135 [Etheostoma spectabile]